MLQLKIFRKIHFFGGYSGLYLEIEVEGRKKKVEGGSGVLLIPTLRLKCNNSQVIKAL